MWEINGFKVHRGYIQRTEYTEFYRLPIKIYYEYAKYFHIKLTDEVRNPVLVFNYYFPYGGRENIEFTNGLWVKKLDFVLGKIINGDLGEVDNFNSVLEKKLGLIKIKLLNTYIYFLINH